jgi:glycosyltransferase involved in cell wall biosynthesis
MISQTDKPYIVINPDDSELTSNIIDFEQLPLVSFCIPTKNNEETLDACLSSIKKQDYPRIEIIIIDGCSTDKTIEIAKKYSEVIIVDAGGYGKACQIGLMHASGPIIASMDSDIILPHSHWLINAIKYFNYSKIVSTVWPVNTAPPGSSLTTRLYFNIWKLTIDNRIKYGRSYYGGGNCLFRKDCFISIGGINPSMHWGADFDWAMKFQQKGYQVILLQDPIYHDTMRTLHEFYRKQFTGAKTFTKTGFQLMGLTTKDILYENFILGMKGMLRGLFIERDISWIYYPVFLSIRVLAYSSFYIVNQRPSRSYTKK